MTDQEDVVFVVEGTCGEWSDRSDWIVCWYPTEAEAQDHAVKAKQRADEIQAKAKSMYHTPEAKNEYDPYCRWDYTGTDYTVIPVPRGVRTW